MSLIPSGAARRDALYAKMRRLCAPEAKKLREAWGIGVSGAKLSLADCERLYDLAGA